MGNLWQVRASAQSSGGVTQSLVDSDADVSEDQLEAMIRAVDSVLNAINSVQLKNLALIRESPRWVCPSKLPVQVFFGFYWPVRWSMRFMTQTSLVIPSFTQLDFTWKCHYKMSLTLFVNWFKIRTTEKCIINKMDTWSTLASIFYR